MEFYEKCLSWIKGEKGTALVIALCLLAIMAMMGAGILNRSSLQIKSVGSLRRALTSSLSAESGVFGVTGWMLFNRRSDVPTEIREKSGMYETDISILDGSAIMELPGYSAKWRGMITRIDSFSPDQANAVSTIESVTFVPVGPAGYGNEPR